MTTTDFNTPQTPTQDAITALEQAKAKLMAEVAKIDKAQLALAAVDPKPYSFTSISSNDFCQKYGVHHWIQFGDADGTRHCDCGKRLTVEGVVI